MLAQILQDMYVDPDILEELPEEQKQILFLKMREEQVRRWQKREDELLEQEKTAPPRPKQKKCKFELTAINDHTVRQSLKEESYLK